MSRSVLITGGSRGIGLAIAEHLLAAGDKVAVTYLTTEPPKIDGLLAVRCDVRDTEQVNAAVEEVEREQGEVEVLVANAGITTVGLLKDLTDEQWEDVISVNLTGTMKFCRRVGKVMESRGAGRIIVMSSAMALAGGAGQSPYAASKTAQLGFVRAYAEEVAESGVTVNAVCPGPTETDMYRALPAETQAAFVNLTRTKRVIQPSEVAATVQFLASPEAASITGEEITVAGGATWGR